jgi:osmoprotectant transport system permease protein
MSDRIASALELLPEYLSEHIFLSAAALVLGLALSLPLALWAARDPRVRWPVMAAASLVQTIPGLALLALFYPLLLALSALTSSLFGVGISALGFMPSVLALTLYSMLPILRNGVAGLTGIDPGVIEAADGVGMTRRQRLVRVEIPLAAPVVMAGVRTAAVWTIGAATLSTSVGQTSLGNYIFSGLQTENWVYVLFGCASATVLALIVDQLLGLVEDGIARRKRNKVVFGAGGLAAGLLATLASVVSFAPAPLVIGAKGFNEQFILAQLISNRLEAQGAAVTLKENLGSAIVFRALSKGEIDVYVDYSGTLWTNVMRRKDVPPRDEMLRQITSYMQKQHGVVVLGNLGFENAYALAIRQQTARSLSIGSIDDLTRHAGSLKLGADLEFLSRPEWTAIQGAYHLDFAEKRSFNPTFMYRAIEDGTVDVITAFSSDGRIAAQKLVVLEDPRNVIPSYDAIILVSPRRATDQRIRRALSPLIGRIDVSLMREANLMVDRDKDKSSPLQAAQVILQRIGVAGR